MNCPVCLRESTPVKRGEAAGYKLLLCQECGVIYADPMRAPGARWYEESEVYGAGRVITKTPEWYHRAVLKTLPGGSLLDIGCGTGVFLGEAKKLGFDVWGVDFDRNNIMLIKDTVFNALSIIPGMVLRLFRLKGGGLVCTARVK